jgi:hypothetical protein
MTDITQAEDVEIVLSKAEDGFRLWINVDGKNRFRCYRIKHIEVDNRPETRILENVP